MNVVAILSLISDLYAQVQSLQEKVTELESEQEAKAEMMKEAP